MKKIFAATVVLATLGMAQQVLASDGTVNFTGSVVNAPCVVGSGNGVIKVDLGQVKTSDFGTLNGVSSTAGTKAPSSKAFQIILSNCTPTAGQTVTATFTGQQAAGTANGQYLAIDGVAGSATNVGIEIDDGKNVVVPMNTVSSAVTLLTGQTTMNFVARYVALGGIVTPGTANATTDFNLTYK